MLTSVHRQRPTEGPSHFPKVEFALVPPIKEGGEGLRCRVSLPEGAKGSDEGAIINIIQEGSIKLPHPRTTSNTIINRELDQQVLMVGKEMSV